MTKQKQEPTFEDRFNEALHGNDEDTYYSIFDSVDSDTVIKLLRNLHADPSAENTSELVIQLNKMLISRVKDID